MELLETFSICHVKIFISTNYWKIASLLFSVELLETLRLFLQCCNSDWRLRSRSSLRSRPLPQKKSIPRASFECFQELKTFSPTFHALRGTFISLVWLPALVWMSSLGLRPRLDNLQTSADNCQTSEIKVPLAARKVGLQFFHVLELLKIGLRNCYSFNTVQ